MKANVGQIIYTAETEWSDGRVDSTDYRDSLLEASTDLQQTVYSDQELERIEKQYVQAWEVKEVCPETGEVTLAENLTV